jgi:hypothetical protein
LEECEERKSDGVEMKQAEKVANADIEEVCESVKSGA